MAFDASIWESLDNVSNSLLASSNIPFISRGPEFFTPASPRRGVEEELKQIIFCCHNQLFGFKGN